MLERLHEEAGPRRDELVIHPDLQRQRGVRVEDLEAVGVRGVEVGDDVGQHGAGVGPRERLRRRSGRGGLRGVRVVAPQHDQGRRGIAARVHDAPAGGVPDRDLAVGLVREEVDGRDPILGVEETSVVGVEAEALVQLEGVLAGFFLRLLLRGRLGPRRQVVLDHALVDLVALGVPGDEREADGVGASAEGHVLDLAYERQGGHGAGGRVEERERVDLAVVVAGASAGDQEATPLERVPLELALGVVDRQADLPRGARDRVVEADPLRDRALLLDRLELELVDEPAQVRARGPAVARLADREQHREGPLARRAREDLTRAGEAAEDALVRLVEEDGDVLLASGQGEVGEVFSALGRPDGHAGVDLAGVDHGLAARERQPDDPALRLARARDRHPGRARQGASSQESARGLVQRVVGVGFEAALDHQVLRVAVLEDLGDRREALLEVLALGERGAEFGALSGALGVGSEELGESGAVDVGAHGAEIIAEGARAGEPVARPSDVNQLTDRLGSQGRGSPAGPRRSPRRGAECRAGPGLAGDDLRPRGVAERWRRVPAPRHADRS